MRTVLPFLLLALGLAAGVRAQPAADVRRGEMLYTTHCIACHRSEIHWRDKRLARDWASLYAQVRRWQLNTGKSWDPGDTAAIARYLNDNFYHFTPGDDIRN